MSQLRKTAGYSRSLAANFDPHLLINTRPNSFPPPVENCGYPAEDASFSSGGGEIKFLGISMNNFKKSKKWQMWAVAEIWHRRRPEVNNHPLR